MAIVTTNNLLNLEGDAYTFTVLTDKDTYYAGTADFDPMENDIVDHFRIGSHIEDSFCIEDSIGRFIPFSLSDIDSLIDTLLNYRQDNEKNIEISKLQAQIREMENECKT